MAGQCMAVVYGLLAWFSRPNRKRNTCIYYIKAVIVRAGEPEPGVFGSLEPEPLEKNSGAGAAKKLAGSSALREDKKHKEIVLWLLFLR